MALNLNPTTMIAAAPERACVNIYERQKDFTRSLREIEVRLSELDIRATGGSPQVPVNSPSEKTSCSNFLSCMNDEAAKIDNSLGNIRTLLTNLENFV
jgi:hypothetical protein